MAQFDLKKATIYLQDGYAEAGAVNNVSGYAAAATTILVDGIADEVPVGATVRFDGDDNIYTVTNTVETLGATTSIDISPGLFNAVIDDQVVTVYGRQLAIKVGEGNLTYDEKRTMEYKKDRGRFDTVREGDEEPIDVRLDIQWEWLSSNSSDTEPTPEEVLKREGGADDWVSSSDDPCEPYSVNIVIVYDPECTDVEAEIIHLQDYRWESINHDLKAGTLSTSGKCNNTRSSLERLVLD